jgi:peptide/nickel transport system substrate-binding protein
MKMLKVISLASLLIFGAMEIWAASPNSNQLSDLRVRKAIAYAIDMDTIVETIFEGMAIAADSSIPNGSFKAPGLDRHKYDPDKARQLLKEANWDSSRVLDVVFYYGDQTTSDLMTAIQAYLADVGIQMTFRKLEGDVGAQLRTLPKDPVNGPSAVKWDLGYGAKAALALQEYYNNYATGHNANTPGSAKLDSLIEAINSTSDVDKQREAFFAIERYEMETLFDIPLYYQQLFIYESKRLSRNGGLYGNAQYNYDWNIVDWTVTPDANGKQVMRTNTGPVEFFEHSWFNPGLYIYTKVLFDRLITADSSLAASHPQMAKHYNLSADGKTLTIQLMDGLTWHDGTPITADEIKWNVEFASKVPVIHPIFKKTFGALKGAKAYANGSASGISGISTKGNTITFKFAELDSNVLLTFSQWAPLPRKHIGSADPLKFQQHSFWQRPVGSGPFKVKEVQMNDYLVMVPFENYHGGRAKLDEIVAYPSGDNSANVIKNAAAGQLDYGFTKNVSDVKTLQEMSHMKVTPVDIPYTRVLWINKFPKK